MQFARCLIWAGMLWLAACSAPQERPNILLISVDTLRADALACYGGEPDVGTQACALAEAGTRYTWAFSTAASTSPAIASLLTSRWVPSHGVTQNLATQLPDEHVTLAEAFTDAGYATAAVVSNPMLHSSRRLNQGFEHYDQRMTRRERNRPGFAERAAGDTTDAALEWAQIQARAPWFLWVHYQDPHGPYDPPQADGLSNSSAAPLLPVLDNDTGLGGIPQYQALPGVRSRAAYERRYRDEIRYVDHHVGRLVEGLDALGTAPAVLLTADHGEALGEDGFYFAHGQSAGLEQIRVPLLWRPPAGAPVTASDVRSASLVDVAPTLLHAAGIEAPAVFAGHALQLPAPAERPLYAEAERQSAIVYAGSYYARDRKPGATHNAEGRPWGSGHPSFGQRHATLGAGPGLPAYDESEPSAPLDARLSAFIRAHPQRSAQRHSDVPAELREQLEALGYATP